MNNFEHIQHLLDPYKRVQNHLKLHDVYPPKKNGVCDCGCGVKLKGRQTRWASKECSSKAVHNYFYIKNDPATMRHLLFQKEEGFCRMCGVYDPKWHADHIIPVFKGGGACGIENFQTLCVDCHKEKTKQDLKR